MRGVQRLGVTLRRRATAASVACKPSQTSACLPATGKRTRALKQGEEEEEGKRSMWRAEVARRRRRRRRRAGGREQEQRNVFRHREREEEEEGGRAAEGLQWNLFSF